MDDITAPLALWRVLVCSYHYAESAKPSCAYRYRPGHFVFELQFQMPYAAPYELRGDAVTLCMQSVLPAGRFADVPVRYHAFRVSGLRQRLEYLRFGFAPLSLIGAGQ